MNDGGCECKDDDSDSGARVKGARSQYELTIGRAVQRYGFVPSGLIASTLSNLFMTLVITYTSCWLTAISDNLLSSSRLCSTWNRCICSACIIICSDCLCICCVISAKNASVKDGCGFSDVMLRNPLSSTTSSSRSVSPSS